MKTADIKVGEHYGYVDHPTANYHVAPQRVKVLEVGVERNRSSSTYWRPREKPLHDGIRVAFADKRFGSKDFVVRPAQIVDTWANIAAAKKASEAATAAWEAKLHSAREANRPLREAVVAALVERGFDVGNDDFGWRAALRDGGYSADEVLAGTKSMSISLSLGDLARLLGVPGEFATPYKGEDEYE